MQTLADHSSETVILRLRRVSDADLRRFDLGRDQRDANHALRELLGTIDGDRC
jgi:hypothetical protein